MKRSDSKNIVVEVKLRIRAPPYRFTLLKKIRPSEKIKISRTIRGRCYYVTNKLKRICNFIINVLIKKFPLHII